MKKHENEVPDVILTQDIAEAFHFDDFNRACSCICGLQNKNDEYKIYKVVCETSLTITEESRYMG